VRALSPPAVLGGIEPAMGSVPALGEHSRNILRELGYSAEATDELISAGVTTDRRSRA
jgi:crotonobetainyl-CoA:carnitine CoA-transferase CaiB-like acyl-CoA transferase